MTIREKEDVLFAKWIEKYNEDKGTFIKDGTPFPEEYSKANKKILFLLKDANFEDAHSKANRFYDQREELADKPHMWWDKMRNWCAPLSNNELTWEEITKVKTKDALSSFSFMQLKKLAGGGSVTDVELNETASDDKEFIKEQIDIYSPSFIICCGNGDIVNNHIYNNTLKQKYTRNGVGYWEVDNNKFLIDYCHPSARFGTKLAGVVALSLAAAVEELAR
jgi:hypothetical protein